MDENKTYYKVCHCNINPISMQIKFQSACSDMLDYLIETWTKPKIKHSKIFVFETYNDAKDYLNRLYFSAIIECKIKNPHLYILAGLGSVGI